MFPILPILILLLLGPANAERLAVEGRLPSVLLAAHRAMVVPVRATVEAPVEEEAPVCAAPQSDKRLPAAPMPVPPTPFAQDVALPGSPTRAGPSVA